MSSPEGDKLPATPSTETKGSGRKFFPRVKALLSEEYEEFLKQIIEILEKHQVASFTTAAENTPWHRAFTELYETVATEHALPQGKNRLHKFKEKMVELWNAMDSEVCQRMRETDLFRPLWLETLKFCLSGMFLGPTRSEKGFQQRLPYGTQAMANSFISVEGKIEKSTSIFCDFIPTAGGSQRGYGRYCTR